MTYGILLVGGGSGGHVYPLVAVAESLKRKAIDKKIDLELMFLGDGQFIRDAALAVDAPYRVIMGGKLRRYSSVQNLIDLFKTPVSFIQSFWHVFWFMPDVVFAKGGSSSVFPIMASKFFFIPVYLHETDSVPGLSNRILAKRAKKIFVAFESAKELLGPAKTEVIGNPIRTELLKGDRNLGVAHFKLEPAKKTILVVGGSQGAKAINDSILANLVKILELGFQIIHQCGETQFKAVKDENDKMIKEGQSSYGQTIENYYKVVPFLEPDELALAYAAADIVISRAGGTVFELAALGKPVIVVPLPDSAGDHQLKNGLEFSRFGAILIEQENLTGNILLRHLESLLDSQTYQTISGKIKSFAKLDAADRIADELLPNA